MKPLIIMDEALWLFNSILNNTWLIPEQERSLSRKDKKKLDYKAPGPTCKRYTGTLCSTNGSIGMDYIYIDISIATQEVYEQKLQSALSVLSSYPNCRSHLSSFLCHTTFPLCDMTNPTPRPQKVCTSYCESVLPHCGSFFDELRNFGTFDNLHPLDIPTNCTSINSVPKDGGTAPECYDQITLTGQIINGSAEEKTKQHKHNLTSERLLFLLLYYYNIINY